MKDREITPIKKNINTSLKPYFMHPLNLLYTPLKPTLKDRGRTAETCLCIHAIPLKPTLHTLKTYFERQGDQQRPVCVYISDIYIYIYMYIYL